MQINPVTTRVYPEGTVPVVLVKGDERILPTHADGVIAELRFGIGNGPWSAEMLVRQIVRHALTLGIKSLGLDFSAFRDFVEGGFSEDDQQVALGMARGAMMAGYTFDRYMKEKKPTLDVHIGSLGRELHDYVQAGKTIGHFVNRARELSNMGASDVTPTYLERRAIEVHDHHLRTVEVTVFGPDDLKQLELNLILAVGKGSTINPPKMLKLAYTGDPKSERLTIICGKGVCYDTGGLSMKSPDAMLPMHHDMAGGAAAIEIIDAIASLDIKRNVTALVPVVENSVSDRSYRPGDVLPSGAGISVEVTNTDAEGRLVLADALWYAHQHHEDVDAIFTIATLTGAAHIALGDMYSGLFSTNDELAQRVANVGGWAADPVWQLPLSPAYAQYLKSQRADLKNACTGGKNGGASSAAWFLQRFANAAGLGDRFVHIDIAPRTIQVLSEEHLAPGSMGAGVSLLVEYFLHLERTGS